MGELNYSLTTEVSYYFQVPAILPSAEDLAVPIEQETGWAQETVCTKRTYTCREGSSYSSFYTTWSVLFKKVINGFWLHLRLHLIHRQDSCQHTFILKYPSYQ